MAFLDGRDFLVISRATVVPAGRLIMDMALDAWMVM